MFDIDLIRLNAAQTPSDSNDYQKLTTRSNATSSRFMQMNLAKGYKTTRSDSGFPSIDQTFDLSRTSLSRRTSFTKFNESEYGADESMFTSISNIKLPKIVLRNQAGNIIRTESSFQRAIAEARVRVREEGRKLTSEEWRLPEAPVPSKPDYSRFGNNDDGQVVKQSTKKRPKLNNGIDFLDPDCLKYLLKDDDLDIVGKNISDMEEGLKRITSIDDPSFVREAPFMSKYQEVKKLTTMYIPVVNKNKSIDSLIVGIQGLNYRKKMILSDILNNIKSKGLETLKGLAPHLRNEMLQNLSTIAEQLPEDVKIQLIKELLADPANLPPDLLPNLLRSAGDQVIRQMLENPQNIDPNMLNELIKNMGSLPDEMKQKIMKEIMGKLDKLPEDVRAKLIKDLLAQPDVLNKDNIQQLIKNMDPNVLRDMANNLDDLDPNLQKELFKALLDNPDLLPDVQRDKIMKELIGNLANLDSEAQQELIKKIMESNLLPPEEKEKILKDLVANIGNLDSETQKQILKQVLENPSFLPPEEREKIIKNLVNNLDNIDNKEVKAQLLKQLLENPNLIPESEREKVIKDLISNLDRLDSDTQKQLLKQIENLPEDQKNSLLKDLVGNIANLDPNLQKKITQTNR